MTHLKGSVVLHCCKNRYDDGDDDTMMILMSDSMMIAVFMPSPVHHDSR